ncbi:hypothetical protein [Catellatospora vulcania]|uniref:hypothetical protein n=1 Tax=Catellatospora vulcania TaxID=1460450 RepID=UPI0012D3BB8C|nr:hypothetical protein [Catellatospora vulcania]
MARPKAGAILGAVSLAVGGALCIVLALVVFGDVLCGNDPMQPGDKCLVTGDSGSAWHSYTEMQDQQKQRGPIFGGLGVLLLLGAVGTLVKGMRDSAKEALQDASAQAWTRES